MFTRLYRHRLGGDAATFAYHAAGYGPGQNGVDPKVLSGQVNAILDFRFSALPQLGWYFDHHVSAFVTPDDLAAMTARLPTLRVEVVPGAGHAVQSDQPLALADVISEFLPAS